MSYFGSSLLDGRYPGLADDDSNLFGNSKYFDSDGFKNDGTGFFKQVKSGVAPSSSDPSSSKAINAWLKKNAQAPMEADFTWGKSGAQYKTAATYPSSVKSQDNADLLKELKKQLGGRLTMWALFAQYHNAGANTIPDNVVTPDPKNQKVQVNDNTKKAIACLG